MRSFILLVSFSMFNFARGFASPSSSSQRASTGAIDTPTDIEVLRPLVNGDDEASEREFLERTKQLCQDRNIGFSAIKNARDLGSVNNSPISQGKVFRMGRPGDATAEDLKLLESLDLTTMIDLRSPTELKDDANLMREEVYGDYVNLLWKERRRKGNGFLRELREGQLPLRKRFWHKRKSDALPLMQFSEEDDALLQEALEEEGKESDADCMEEESCSVSGRKERHFCSLMNEFKYVKGTVSKLRKRDLTKAILTSPGAMFSSRMRENIKKPFLDEINDGGLNMLNELLLRFGAPGIRYVLEVVADEDRHPVGFYCTAGKDRTGALAAIILSLCGAEPEDIVEDYTLSANVYAEMGDHKAMVGALSQRNLDPKTFLGAPATVMRATLQAIEEEYGSVEGYCNWIGFGPEKQEKLRKACMKSVKTVEPK